jgi:hypothetical protein
MNDSKVGKGNALTRGLGDQWIWNARGDARADSTVCIWIFERGLDFFFCSLCNWSFASVQSVLLKSQGEAAILTSNWVYKWQLLALLMNYSESRRDAGALRWR